MVGSTLNPIYNKVISSTLQKNKKFSLEPIWTFLNSPLYYRMPHRWGQRRSMKASSCGLSAMLGAKYTTQTACAGLTRIEYIWAEERVCAAAVCSQSVFVALRLYIIPGGRIIIIPPMIVYRPWSIGLYIAWHALDPATINLVARICLW